MSPVDATTPYPWPWDGEVDRDHLVLVVTGWDRHWEACTSPSGEVLRNIAALAATAPAVVTVSHDARNPVATLPRAGGSGPLELGGVSIRAAGIDAFYGSPLDAVLRAGAVTQLVLAGLGLETTVHSTMRRANDMGLECLLVADACAPVDPGLRAAALSTVEMSGGIFGAVGSTAHTVSALGASNIERNQP